MEGDAAEMVVEGDEKEGLEVSSQVSVSLWTCPAHRS